MLRNPKKYGRIFILNLDGNNFVNYRLIFNSTAI